MFNTQFNVFFWLFQNQPAFGEYFFNNSNMAMLNHQQQMSFNTISKHNQNDEDVEEEEEEEEEYDGEEYEDENEESTKQVLCQSNQNLQNTSMNNEVTVYSYKTPDLTTHSQSLSSHGPGKLNWV